MEAAVSRRDYGNLTSFDHVFVVQGKRIPVKKSDITEKSRYFRRYFDLPSDVITWKESVIKNIDYETFKQLIDYLRYNEMPDLSKPIRFLESSVYFEIDDLHKKCLDAVRVDLGPRNALKYLVVAAKLKIRELLDFILDFVLVRHLEYKEHPFWDIVPLPEFIQILGGLGRVLNKRFDEQPSAVARRRRLSREQFKPVVGRLKWGSHEVTWINLPRMLSLLESPDDVNQVHPSFSPSFRVSRRYQETVYELQFFWLQLLDRVLVGVCCVNYKLPEWCGEMRLEGGPRSYFSAGEELFGRIPPNANLLDIWWFYPGSDGAEITFKVHWNCVVHGTERRIESRIAERPSLTSAGECYIVVQGVKLPCRRIPAGKKSPVLRDILSNGHTIYKWVGDDVSPSDFAVVLRYLHSPSNKFPPPSDVSLSVLRLAKTLELDGLFNFCDDTLAKDIHAENALKYFVHGHISGAPALKLRSKGWLASHLEFLNEDCLEEMECHPELLTELLHSFWYYLEVAKLAYLKI